MITNDALLSNSHLLRLAEQSVACVLILDTKTLVSMPIIFSVYIRFCAVYRLTDSEDCRGNNEYSFGNHDYERRNNTLLQQIENMEN